MNKLLYRLLESPSQSTQYTPNRQLIFSFFIAESRLRRSSGASRELKDHLPDCGDDGSRPGHHHPRQVGRLRFHRERCAVQKVLHPLQAVRGTAL